MRLFEQETKLQNNKWRYKLDECEHEPANNIPANCVV